MERTMAKTVFSESDESYSFVRYFLFGWFFLFCFCFWVFLGVGGGWINSFPLF